VYWAKGNGGTGPAITLQAESIFFYDPPTSLQAPHLLLQGHIPDDHIQLFISNSQHVEQELGKRIRPRDMDPLRCHICYGELSASCDCVVALSTEAGPFDALFTEPPASVYSCYGTCLAPGFLPCCNQGAFMTMVLEPLKDDPGSSEGFEASLSISPSPTPFTTEQPPPPSTALSVNTKLRRCKTCDMEYNTKGSKKHRGFCGLGCKQAAAAAKSRNRNCMHNTRRSTCKLCDGASLCSHKLIRSSCKLCDGGWPSARTN
jgi:hypothetical protein